QLWKGALERPLHDLEAGVVGGVILLVKGIDSTVGIILLVIVGSYLGLDLMPFVPLGKNRSKKKGDTDVES
ncbi:unnamed protein product, partial [marine sediment metagenome]